MKRAFKLFFILLVISCSFSFVKAEDVYDVILFWGQSNMVGYNRPSEDEMKKEGLTENPYSVKDVRLTKLGETNFSKYTGIDLDIVKNYDQISHVKIDSSDNYIYYFDYDYDKSKANLVQVTNDTKSIGSLVYSNAKNGGYEYTKTPKDNSYLCIEPSRGTNMTVYFAKTFHEATKHKIVIVQAANGGKMIGQFKKNVSDRRIHEVTVDYYKKAINYILGKGGKIANKFYVVFQGESNSGDVARNNRPNTYSDSYANTYKLVHSALVSDLKELSEKNKKDYTLDFGVLVSTSAKSGDPEKIFDQRSVNVIKNAHNKIINDSLNGANGYDIPVILGSDYPYNNFYSFEKENTDTNYIVNLNKALLSTSMLYNDKWDLSKSNDVKGVRLRDNRVHFNAAALSQIGRESAKSAINNLSIKVTFHESKEKYAKTYTQKFKQKPINTQYFGLDSNNQSNIDFNKWNKIGYDNIQGWSTDKNATNAKWKTNSGVSDNWIIAYSPKVDLYAVYSPVNYKVNYDMSGGSASSTVSTYTINSNNITLPTPTKNGYLFTGWKEQIVNLSWNKGFINIKTGVIENNKEYPNTYYSDFFYLKGGVTYTISGIDGYKNANVRWRCYNMDGSYKGTGPNSNVFKPSKDYYVRLMYFDSPTDSQMKNTVITADNSLTSQVIKKGSVGNRKYTATWKSTSNTVDEPKCNNLTYNGKEQTLINSASEYTLVNNKATNAGTYTVTVKLNSGYKWNDKTTIDKSVKCVILRKNIKDAKISSISKQEYTGSEIKPSIKVTIKLDGKEITLGSSDYKIRYSNNINISDSAMVVVEGIGNYIGSTATTFTIYGTGSGNNVNTKPGTAKPPQKSLELDSLVINNLVIPLENYVDVYEYKASSDTDSLNIKAESKDSGVSVKIDPPDELELGTSVVSITVSDGTDSKTYQVLVDKNDSNPSTDSSLETIEVNNKTIKVDKDKNTYKVKLNKDEKLDINYVLGNDNANVEVIGEENIEDGGVVKLLVTAEDGSQSEYNLDVEVSDGGFGVIDYILLSIFILIAVLILKNRKKTL